jgi:hypothetical protein
MRTKGEILVIIIFCFKETRSPPSPREEEEDDTANKVLRRIIQLKRQAGG